MISQVVFWPRTTKILISYCFLQHFCAVGTSGKTVFFTLFGFLSWAICKKHWFSLGFPMFFAHTWSSCSWSLKNREKKKKSKKKKKTLPVAIFENHWFSLGFPMFLCPIKFYKKLRRAKKNFFFFFGPHDNFMFYEKKKIVLRHKNSAKTHLLSSWVSWCDQIRTKPNFFF